MATELTTTSYAVLGLLATRSWTTYELAQQMGRALGAFWPRAQSKLYEEPKKLVAHGLARASSDQVGRRPRTVYSITPEGRRALADWVRTDSSPPVLESEALVKVFFAEHGSRDDLLRAINSFRDWADERAVLGLTIPREYLEGRGAFPQRLPWLILVGRFLEEYEFALRRWAEWASDVVERWPDDLPSAEPEWVALTEMAAHYEALVRSASQTTRNQ